MRVFVTGATGFIGSAIVTELRASGHDVLGLVRSDAAAEKLAKLGVDAHRGELVDSERLAAGARVCDGVVHTAFIHDFTAYAAAAETDRRAVLAIAEALHGSNKPFVSTSGTALLAPGKTGTEADLPAPGSASAPRAGAETIVLDSAKRGVRSSVVRLPPSVHGKGDHAFVPALVDVARRTGVSAYVGEGANRWPAVHRLDAARLFRLALEKAPPGTTLHGVAEEGITLRTIAEAIGAGLGLPVQSVSAEAGAEHFGWLAYFIGIDNPTSSAITRSTMGWSPQGPDLLNDMKENGYFSD